MQVDRHVIERVVRDMRRIAVVGLSDDPWRTSNSVARDLIDMGYEIVPVNPTVQSVFGLTSYPRVADIPGDIDVVDVFRRPEFTAEVARDAVVAGARALWLQTGVRSREARAVATRGGLDYVEDACLRVETARFGRVSA